MAYVYLHRKKTNNIVFYVGIGSDSKGLYTRAYTKYGRGRNSHWANVVNKHGYYVEICNDNIIWEQACVIEKYLIEFYGRKDLNKGSLVNKTSGGEGVVGTIFTEERKKKISQRAKGRVHPPHTEETKQKISKVHKGKIVGEKTRKLLRDKMIGKEAYNKGVKMSPEHYLKLLEVSEKYKIPIAKYNLDGKFLCRYNSIIEAAKDNQCSQGNITNCCKKKSISYAGYLWRYAKDAIPLTIPPHNLRIKKVIQCSLDGVPLNEYDSAVDAARKNGWSRSVISRTLKRKNNKAYNFKWIYKNINEYAYKKAK